MLTRESLLFSPTRDGVPSSDDAFTAGDLVAAQEAIEREAREVMPFEFNSCTSDLGYIKQAVELFTRRDFKCDCGTERMGAGSKCSLSGRDDERRNGGNKYSKNFQGVFCICGVPYDPHTETDAMYQCLVCEDWLHHTCLFGSHSDAQTSPLGTDDFDLLICASCVTSDSRLRPLLDRWAGVEGKGVMVIGEDDVVKGRAAVMDSDGEVDGGVKEEVVKAEGKEGVKKEENDEEGVKGKAKEEEKDDDVAATTGGEKRRADVASTSSTVEPPAKKLKSDVPAHSSSHVGSDSSFDSSASTAATSASTHAHSQACIAPPVPRKGESVLDQLQRNGARMNVYLEEGWIERWCRCSSCITAFTPFSYFLEEEDIYEPPVDTDAGKSTMELGMEAFERLPRTQAINGAIAFTELSSRLREYLRPKAEAGETVTKGDVERFFEMEKERRRERG
ncbi:E3 ubiquitin-protein ligase UBR7 [Pseudohyphozyma bogoriensis]|nr:E3 ubiquitin-protein ligase UBR7 [Pseudohyphozyma bogoriensis]